MNNLLYLTFNIQKENKGVYNKVSKKVQLLSSNINTLWINICTHKRFIQIENDIFFYKNLEIEFENILSKKIKTSGNIIIFRHVPFPKILLIFFKKNIVFSEHNSKELEEYFKEFLNFSLRDWIYLMRTGSIYVYIKNLLFYKIKAIEYYKSIKGFIAVTNEIRNYQYKYYDKNTPSITISNGINNLYDLDYTRPLIDKSLDINLIFFAGGNFLWHNFNRLYDSINKYSSRYNFRIYYYGQISEKEKKADVVYFNDFKDNIYNIISSNSIGVGSLGLYKIGLNEACPLKVRDYLSLCMPIILGFDDTDIENNKFLKKITLNVGNNKNNIDIDVIEKWIDEISIYSRLDIKNNLSKIMLDYKINQLVTFIDEVSKK
jgi:hypothetical protein